MYRTIGVMFLFSGLALAVDCNNANTLTGTYQTAAAMTGCLSAAGGLTEDGGATAWDNFYVAWNITLSGGVYTYNYTFKDPGDTHSPGVSGDPADALKILLGISTSCNTFTKDSRSSAPNAECLWSFDDGDIAYDGKTRMKTFTSSDYANIPNVNGVNSIWAIEFTGDNDHDDYDTDVTFKSDRAPVWQNFYAQGETFSGGPSSVYNTGWGNTTTAGYFLAAPDTNVASPEPGLVGLLMAGMAGLFIANRRRKAA